MSKPTDNPIRSAHSHDYTVFLCMLADWTFTRYHTPDQPEYAVVYGTVAQDFSGRFTTGSRIRTSPVSQWESLLAHTHNSVYFLPEGAGCFCDLPATVQPTIDSLGVDPAEAAAILHNALKQPAPTLPETAYFGVPVIRPAGQSDCPVVMERHIAALPFYPFWRDSSIGSAQSLIDGQTAVFLHDWNAFCRLFVRTGKHRHQTDNNSKQAADGQYSYFGLPVVRVAELGNASTVAEADIAKLPFYAYWRETGASDVYLLADGTYVVHLADWEAFCRQLVLAGR
ncbi:Uncharacterised protein [Eikenella corrodens]|uniref:Uncharacterized protein n=3 Tax=Eikenella corrodens TaxID=539 RepID=C0DSM1_EIKCO|nr:hypothetical protein EIKCOROL_00343 [Eikenella corrodens ATCC 23834]SNW09820.1 Uncharacterised protein [Eikenella corrodens]